MKLKLLFLLVSISVNSWLNSTTWHIKQDGTSNFTTIQEGIIVAINADTVLVYPGTFLENIDFSGKNITVASLYLTTGNEEYMYNTIIDGNQNGSCVRIMSGEDSTTVLCGFTLKNGTGTLHVNDYLGGGIYIVESQPIINNCLITNNVAKSGGGICCRYSNITLSKTKIIDNHAYASGGGISLAQESNIVFDNENLCDIYLNYSSGGCEIRKTWDSPPLEVYVDTFTVTVPDGYFICSTTTTGVPLNDVTLYCQNAKLEPVNSDLFVSTNGDNNNSGLFAYEPLSTINFALSLVTSDTLHPNTIHIADGMYSKTINNQCFPLNMRGYVSLIGESMENTIFDAGNHSPHIHDGYSKLDYSIKNISFINGNGNSSTTSCMSLISPYQQGKFINLENISITDCEAYSRNINLLYMDVYMKNIYSYSNYSELLWALNSFQAEQEVIIENIYIHNNQQYDPGSPYSDAGPQLSFGMLGTLPMNVTITNMELTENIQYQSDWPESSSGIGIGDNVNLNLINCTIGNNSSPGNGGTIRIGPAGKNSVINIYNSILYGDLPGEIYIDNEFSSNPSTVNIQNSLVDGGFEGIENIYSWNTINWLEGNLDTIPMWTGTGEYPYALSTGSPCIDAGTLNLPPGIVLPEYDLAGNSRIYGETIDMGAYEWQGVGVVNNKLHPTTTGYKMVNYPNPFNPSTTISFNLLEEGEVKLEIYNIKGQKVKTLFQGIASEGEQSVVWEGRDTNGKEVGSGLYFYQLETKDKELTKKMLLLK